MEDLNMNTKKNECKVYFGDWSEGKFIYEYQSNGNDIEVIVDIVDEKDGDEFTVNGKSIGLGSDDFRGCEDIDDCCIVIGKHLIKDNDSNVKVTIIPPPMSGTKYTIHLTKGLEYDTNLKEDWTLTLGADQGRPLRRYEFFEIDKKDFTKVESMILSNDEDGLDEYTWKNYPFESPDLMDLWGDEWEERLSYEVFDENGNEVKSDIVVVCENDVVYYDEYHKKPKGKTFDSPKYVLMKSDVVKRSWCSFSVARNFDICGVHLIGQNHFDDKTLYWGKEVGDTITSIFNFRYNGKFYSMDDGSDCGTWGYTNYSLYKWNDEKNDYNIIEKH